MSGAASEPGLKYHRTVSRINPYKVLQKTNIQIVSLT